MEYTMKKNHSTSTRRRQSLLNHTNLKESKKEASERSHIFSLIKENWDIEQIHKKREIKIILLDNKKDIAKVQDIAIDFDLVDPTYIVNEVADNKFFSFIVAENTTTANFFPKADSLKKMEDFKKAGEMAGVELYDYFVFSKNGFFSYSKNKYQANDVLTADSTSSKIHP